LKEVNAMARERKQTGAEKVIAFRVSEPTFQALERLKRRHARSWPELTLKAITRAFGEASEEDAQDCRQVEAELRGEIPAGPAGPSGAVAAPAEMVVEATEPAEVAETPANEETLPGEAPATPANEETTLVEAPALPASNGEPQKLVAAVVTCKGCQGRMTRGTMVVKRADGYYHPQCLPAAVSVA
jgi:hypothetical protein